MNDFNVLIPASIDFQKLINRNPNKYGKVNLNIVKCILASVLRGISYKDVKKWEKVETLETGRLAVRLYSGTLKHLYVSSNYKRAIDFLLDNDVFFKAPYSKTENISNAYTLHYKYLNSVRVEKLDSNNKANRTIIQRQKEQYGKTKSLVKAKFNFLIKFYKPDRLQIDFENAQRQIEQEYEADNSPNSYKNYLAKMQKIVDIKNGVYWFAHKPETDGRLHTSILQLNKSLRHHLTYDSKKLVEIDISNSVPFILSFLLVKASDIVNLIVIPSSISIVDKQVSSNEITKINDIPYMWLKNAESLDMSEVRDFHKLCSNGNLYESFFDDYLKQYPEHLDKLKDEKRKLVKTELLAMLNADNNAYNYIKMRCIFKKHYPTIHVFLQKIKKDKYKLFSHFLFQIESHVMLELVARAYNKNHSGKIPIFTMHDCIVTTKSHADELKAYMNAKLKEIFTVCQPTIKDKIWELKPIAA